MPRNPRTKTYNVEYTRPTCDDLHVADGRGQCGVVLPRHKQRSDGQNGRQRHQDGTGGEQHACRLPRTGRHKRQLKPTAVDATDDGTELVVMRRLRRQAAGEQAGDGRRDGRR